MRWPPRGLPGPGKAALAAWAVAWLLLCSMAADAFAQAAAPLQPLAPAIVLQDGAHASEDAIAGMEWTDVSGTATLAQVLAGQALFTPLQPERIRALGANGALWIRLRLARAADSESDWLAEVPLPPVDFVTLYQQDASGAWQAQAAGDRLAVDSWPEPGRFPVFRLSVPSGDARDVFFRVQHNAHSSIPLRITPAATHSKRMQMSYLGLGLVFGGLGLLIAACLAQSLVYRDGVFFGYAAYASAIALAMAAYTGAGAHLLWPQSGFIADLSQGGLGLVSAAAAMLFVRNLSGIAAHMPRLAALARWSALGLPFLLAAYVVADRPDGVILLGTYLAFSCAINMLMAWLSWRRGNAVGAWILAAYLPLAAAVGLTLLRVFGLSGPSWANQNGLIAAMAVQVPLLLVALNLHSRERHGARTRELALSSQDALTGLLAPHLFHDRVRQVVARHRRQREGAAVLFIDLVNHERIKQQHGSAVAEQSLLRSVIKLRRLLREVDTLSRIGEARFGVILERIGSRVAVTDRAARVVAAGMLQMKGQNPEFNLQFHLAAALLEEVGLEAPELAPALAGLLESMSPETRRPIRFLGTERTQPLGLGDEADADSGWSEAPATYN